MVTGLLERPQVKQLDSPANGAGLQLAPAPDSVTDVDEAPDQPLPVYPKHLAAMAIKYAAEGNVEAYQALWDGPTLSDYVPVPSPSSRNKDFPALMPLVNDEGLVNSVTGKKLDVYPRHVREM